MMASGSNLHLALCVMLLSIPALHTYVILDARQASSWRLGQVSEFSWSKCDDLPHPGNIKSLSVNPDPIPVPGDVNVAVVASTSIDLESPLTLTLALEKLFLGAWIKVPCVDNLGSCTYDVCDTLDKLFPVGQQCPEPLHTYGIPCHCPFKAGTYSVPSSAFYIPDVPLPSWLESGTYRVKGTLSNAQGEVGCANIQLSLTSPSHSWWK
ncbi:ganglioside GM2 activator [Ambystoma mexicanum]|uniref:ganglioside GM2 activator n=1 Tax=Ambystoma mexicanum TaxID=8296 RepID=UPI0037E8D686